MNEQAMHKEIKKLSNAQNAIILAHNYQPKEIQDIADLCGDSLELSIQAAETEADVIVFCGVRFMAETASILSPEKTVLLPVQDAGCPMADMVTPEALKQRKQELNNIPVVTYVNSTAAVKALSDICCTSANVIDVVNSLDADEVLMTPDRNLSMYADANTDKTIHFWDGYCPFHDNLTTQDILAARKAHPDAVVIAHPECPSEVLQLSDTIQSTSGMIRYAGESDSKEFILATEVGLLYPISKAHPKKKFYPASEKMLCPDMKKITLKDIISSLTDLSGEVRVPENTRKDAIKAVQRMIDLKK